MVVTLPLLLLLIDFWPLGRVRNLSSPLYCISVPQFSFLSLAAEKIPLLLLSAASSLLTMWAQRPVIFKNELLPLVPRIANAIYAYAAYIGKTFWPAHLASFYPYEGLRMAGWQVSRCSRALLSMGMELRGRGQLSEAIDEYKLALRYAAQGNTPEDKAMRSQILSGMASCYESQGDFMTARNYYQEAIKLSPRANPDLFVSFAQTFTDEQIVSLAAALVQHPTAQGYLQLGQLQESTSRIADAEKSYHRALEIDPHFALAQTALVRNGAAGR